MDCNDGYGRNIKPKFWNQHRSKMPESNLMCVNDLVGAEIRDLNLKNIVFVTLVFLHLPLNKIPGVGKLEG